MLCFQGIQAINERKGNNSWTDPKKWPMSSRSDLNRNSKFQFKCHKGVKCFTECCRDINIILTPYDIIRLKNRLELSSEEFLAIYTEPHILEKTDLPVITLKLLEKDGSDSDSNACPFVREDGCLVYADRPTTCRYYPLGVASLSHKEDSDGDEFYFFVHEPHCLGFEEDKTGRLPNGARTRGWIFTTDQCRVDRSYGQKALLSTEYEIHRTDQKNVFSGQLQHRQI